MAGVSLNNVIGGNIRSTFAGGPKPDGGAGPLGSGPSLLAGAPKLPASPGNLNGGSFQAWG